MKEHRPAKDAASQTGIQVCSPIGNPAPTATIDNTNRDYFN